MGPPNPLCYCGRYSRGQRTSVAKGQKLFYKCWDMKCRFWEREEEPDTHSDAYSTPPKASSSQGSWASAVKVEKTDPFRSPSPAVIAPASHVFQSPSPVKVEKSDAFQSPPAEVAASNNKVYQLQSQPPAKLEQYDSFRSPSSRVIAPAIHVFQSPAPVKVEKSDAFQSPPAEVAASNSNMYQLQSPPPAKLEQSDPFRSPPSAVAAPASHVFRSPSPVKAQPNKAALQSPVQVSCSEVSPSPKKEPLPLPAANNDLKDGLSGLTLNGSGLPMPEPKRARSGRGWRRFLCWKV